MSELPRGFLPEDDPVERLPPEYAAWEETARSLPKYLAAGIIRDSLRRLPALDPASLLSSPALAERAMLLLSYFGHAYVWGGRQPVQQIPATVAAPWYKVARHLGRPPVLSYASYALHNWRRIAPNGPVELGNLALLQNFLGGMDEEWFILVHVDIEAKAAPALHAIRDAQAAVDRNDRTAVVESSRTIGVTLEQVHAVLSRMPEKCDPYIYYNRVRPYIHGWKDHPALPAGLIYAGVEEYHEIPQRFRGETGAQSSIIPSLDAALGVAHPESPLSAYLREMRDYMPPAHRDFIAAIERGPSIRQFIASRPSDRDLRNSYNVCLHHLERFRALHLSYAAAYIQNQHEQDAANPAALGTGGTPFMQYLEEHRRTTQSHLL